MKTTRTDRVRGAVYGQLVGDAASLGTHWIYDTNELLDRYQGEIRGFENPAPDHYHAAKRTGEQTHYGDAALLLVSSLADSNNRFDVADFGMRFITLFSSESYRGYRDHATKDTIENIRDFVSKNPNTTIPFSVLGSEDDQMASVTSFAPLLAVSDDLDSFLERADRFTRVRQNNLRSRAYVKVLAIILWNLVEGAAPADAVQNTLDRLDKTKEFENEAKERIEIALSLLDEKVITATDILGQSCPLPGSVPAAIHAFLRHSGDYRTAILETIKAGGDNAGRSSIVGALVGATLGFESIPLDWLGTTKALPEIDRLFASKEVCS